MTRWLAGGVPALTAAAALAVADGLQVRDDEWSAYGHDQAGTHYSPLDQINRRNVGRLEVAWTYRTGDFLAPGGSAGRFESTPLVVDGVLYVTTPFGRVIALDPETGRERWTFDPRIDLEARYGDFTNRGVATWRDPARPAGVRCRRRVFVATVDARLIALDSVTGGPCADFGVGGQVDLNHDLVNPPGFKGEYAVTSPPAILGDLVIVGSAVADNQRADAPSGVVRAFHARTGRLQWSWDPIPRDAADRAYLTWRGSNAHRTGAANAWSVLTVDVDRDLVFVPVGSASPDFYGGERLGENRYANSLVALRGSTGTVVWHFQVVHHDLWDYDVPAQPVLLAIRRDGADIPAVAQPTKMGHLFVFHRETGTPLFPVEERAVPSSTVPGEEASPTQPFPTVPRPLVPARLTPADAWGISDADRAWCRDRIASLSSEGIFTPPSLQGTIIFPGNIGGSHWGGMAWDPDRHLLVGPTNRLAFVVRLVPRDGAQEARMTNRRLEFASQAGTPFAMLRDTLMTPGGVPCNQPPWGTLSAVDVSDGSLRWDVPLGSRSRTVPVEEGRWGSPNLGGAMVTRGGLTFIAATLDEHLRAFETETGREIWSAPLPAGGNATPMTYAIHGRQFVVIAAGGHDRLGTTLGDHVIAFALPGSRRLRAVPPAAPAALAGHYEGQLIAGHGRHPATLDLHAGVRDGISDLSGTLRLSEEITVGALRLHQNDRQLTFSVEVADRARRCDGVVEGEGELANGGTMLVGTLRVTGACSSGHDVHGTFALRRTG